MASLRAYMCGGANIPPAIAEQATRELPSRFCPVFGMTEHGHSTGTDGSTPLEKVTTTVGWFQPEMEARVVSDEGVPRPPGHEGQLQLRGPFNFVGYIQGRAFTSAYFDDEDFFSTGDLAVIDADGYLRITGRVKDLILRGGENIPVKEIEDLISAHPAVREVAIVGVPDARLGERAVACVRLWDGHRLELDNVRAHLERMHVTRQSWPEGLAVMEQLRALPRGRSRSSSCVNRGSCETRSAAADRRRDRPRSAAPRRGSTPEQGSRRAPLPLSLHGIAPMFGGSSAERSLMASGY